MSALRATRARILERARVDGAFDLLFVPAVLLLMVLYLSIFNEYFLDPINIRNIFLQGAVLAFVAFGMTFVILAGELDLSVGAVVALTSVVAAHVMRDSGSVLLGFAAALGVGALVGAVNGLIVTVLQVPSFIATLGTMVTAQGIALASTDGTTIAPLPSGVGTLATSSFLGITLLIWLTVGVFLLLLAVQTQTRFGLRVFAIGGNREAARLAAVPVARVRFLVFVLSGTLAAVGGIALTARVQSGQPTAGGLLALTAIAAVVVGGTDVFGGKGSIVRTVWGVLLISVLTNGLDLIGVNDDLQQVIVGVVFVLAASTGFVRRQFGRRRSRRVAIEVERGRGDPSPAPVPEGVA
ncbi:ABC transporter permease [Conexibacter sp. CPCC 206217]|uniref:ABC transporter permease n=1 Tax=Conexibacter sp. CPCC 206217 TaxID=3064574 RepID=UPI00271DA37C|nr:ABC transporter permease [Conexibacter sp. CPCC 206217]MDO8212045.1 ABC transporter permease [Conexibacter sp. CPCC 206217]